MKECEGDSKKIEKLKHTISLGDHILFIDYRYFSITPSILKTIINKNMSPNKRFFKSTYLHRPKKLKHFLMQFSVGYWLYFEKLLSNSVDLIKHLQL